MEGAPRLEALDLTHVLYDPTSNVALALALATLSPILLMACYGALTIVTRDFLILNMWIGQFGCEAVNWILKHTIKQERPSLHMGGYGFPSSHSQFMGFFASFLLLHLQLRHRFTSTNIPIVDKLWGLVVQCAVAGLALVVCYSRFHLGYHTPSQILWGLGIGISLGVAYYGLTEYIPSHHPRSLPAKLRRGLLQSPVFTWLRIQDGWAVWQDGGHEEGYRRWRELWDKQVKSS
ncbi:PAP2-domain-containing protein [Serendipita vermifera]|nr:PAP2-domain-containing protein [Serendipita vermifera]